MTIWFKDINHRVYERGEDGRAVGGPVYREHWRPYEVVSETKQSWVLLSGLKVPKNPAKRSSSFALTQEEVEQDIWINDHRAEIAQLIYRFEDVEKLKQIAKIVGYHD